mmetsp:Transcript_70841/g.122703  ORF Transcript_70841/g.122703 Transcript_70841/m.122703 type:complete len:661 (-) Transcript_70841:44-2026(-)
MSVWISSLWTSLLKSSMSSFMQELLVLGVFFASFLIWRHFGPRRFRGPPPKLYSTSGDLSSSPRKIVSGGCEAAFGSDDSCSAGRFTSSAGLRSRQLLSSIAASETSPPPHVQAAEQQMLRHLEQREFTRALNMYRALERDGRDRHFSEELYSAFIQSAIRVGKVDVVERMLRAMKRSRVPATLMFWQTILKMLSSRKHFSACLSLHSLFEKELPTDKIVFSCMINAALEVGAPERAAGMLDRYRESDLDAKDYVLFFRTYVAQNDLEAAEGIFRKLGDQVTTLMLNLLLLICVNTKQPDKALALLLEAHTLEANLEEKIVDPVSYNTLIKGFAQAGMLSRCFDCLHEMLKRSLEPDDITFGTLLDMCIVDNNMGAANEVVNLLVGSDRPMDTVMCTLFIKGLVRANCLPKAMELYEEMRRREGACPDIVTYSVLIKALVDQHDLEKALHLMADMTKVGHRPDDIILTHLLEGCRHVGNHTLGKKLFEDMLAAGVKPSEFTLVTMLKLHGRCGAHKEAYALVADWEKNHGVKPSVIHYTCLMSGCLRTKNYNQAWSAYELMCENHVPVDETAISTLLPGMVATQQWDRTLTLVRHALKATPPISIPTETLNNALAQMRQANSPGRHAEQLQSLMQQAGIPLTTRNARRLPSGEHKTTASN